MNYNQLRNSIFEKKNFLCVGLDPDYEKIPNSLKIIPLTQFEFCKKIIDAVAPYCIAFKPNTAFFEERGIEGWASLERTIEYIKKNYPNHFTIADAKRGDIGNTAEAYAKTFLKNFNFDSVTISPYMGRDSILPFLKYKGKWSIVLALTSNKSADDLETKKLQNSSTNFEEVINFTLKLGTKENTMFVVGATRPNDLKYIRNIIPDHFLLIPGIGAQGGNLMDVVENAWNKDCGILVNASRSIIFASSHDDFAEAAGAEAKKIAIGMSNFFR
jgi:orotidine-5'-phosphate decarboxylase